MYLSIAIALLISFIFYRKTVPAISNKRKYILFSLRALVIYAILMLLFNPILYFQTSFTERPVFLILSDKSNSMKQIIEGKTKSEHLSYFESEMRRLALRSNYSVENIDLFTNNPRQSILLDEIRNVLHSGREIKGIVLASDGWFQDDQALFREMIEIPIYTFNPMLTEINSEIIIDNINYNQNVAVNEIQPLRVTFTANNITGEIHGILRHEDRVVSRASINSQATGLIQHTLEFSFSFAETGLKVFQIEIVSAEDNDINDTDFAAVQVIDNKSKILIITDSFNWDVRVFNRYLNFGDRFNAEIVYLHTGRLQQAGNNITVNWTDYNGFIIVSSGNLNLFDRDVNTIKNMILNGAGLIFIGNINRQFEDILPARVSNIRITSEGQARLNPIAMSYQIFRDIETHFDRFPPVQFHYFTAKELSVVLAEVHDIQRIPVLFLGNYGMGDILQFAFNGIWRWQLNTDQIIFDRFINGIIQWIFSTSTDNFYAFTDKNIYYSGEKITVKLTAFDERLAPLRNINARLELFKDDEMLFTDFLVRNEDMFVVNLPDLVAGTYSYRIFDDLNNKEAKGEFEVLEQDIQDLSKGFNNRLLVALSQASKGLNMTNNDVQNFEIERAESVKKNRYIEIPLYRNIVFISIFLIAFCTELYLRKKWGLL